jgi:integrase/recombinase XerD
MAITLKAKNKIQTSVKVDQQNNDTITISKFVELHSDFIREKQLENLSPRTINDHRYLFTFFTRWLDASNWSDRNQCVQKSLFLDYKEYMLFEKNYAACTVNIRIRPLKTYINWLLKHNHIRVNYNNFFNVVKVSDDRVHPLSVIEVRKLIDAIGDHTYARYRDLILTFTILDCGIRINELLDLTVHDINFKDSYIIVQASVSKTRTERTLPISRRTLEYLEQLRDIALEQHMEYLFLSTTGLKKIDANDIFHNFRQYKKDAGIIKKCTPYVLRHTFATEMVKKGVDIFTLQRMMGHKNITTTRQYVFLDNADIIAKHKESGILDYFLK